MNVIHFLRDNPRGGEGGGGGWGYTRKELIDCVEHGDRLTSSRWLVIGERPDVIVSGGGKKSSNYRYAYDPAAGAAIPAAGSSSATSDSSSSVDAAAREGGAQQPQPQQQQQTTVAPTGASGASGAAAGVEPGITIVDNSKYTVGCLVFMKFDEGDGTQKEWIGKVSAIDPVTGLMTVKFDDGEIHHHINPNDKDVRPRFEAPGGSSSATTAAAAGHAAAVRALIAGGAELEAKGDNGATAFLLACSGGHVECVEMLIEAGCDVKVQLHNGKTAMDIAKKSDNEAAVLLLQIGRAHV